MLHELRSRGTIAAAAQALSLTPSAVSQQLSQLQRDAGVTLFRQAGRGIRLTAAGQLLADHAESLLTHMERAENELARHTGSVRGTLRIAGFATAIVHLLAPCLTPLATEYPALRIEVENDETGQVLQRLILREADLVLADEYDYLPRPRDRRLKHEVLLAEAVRLALPVSHPLARQEGPVSLSALETEAWACGTVGTSHASMMTHVCNRLGGFHPDVRHRSDDLTALRALVSTGTAVALLPDLVGACHDPTVTVRDLAEGRFSRLVLAWTRAADPAEPSLGVVVGALKQSASRLAI